MRWGVLGRESGGGVGEAADSKAEDSIPDDRGVRGRRGGGTGVAPADVAYGRGHRDASQGGDRDSVERHRPGIIGALRLAGDEDRAGARFRSPTRVLAIINGRVRHLKSPYLFFDHEAGADFNTEAARSRISHHAKKAMVDAGIADASFHTLRHTAAAWMVQDGVPLYEVQHVLGHSTPVMTQRYAHLQPEHLRRAVNALDKKLKASGERHAAEKGQK